MLDGFNIGFTAVFLLECILKLIAFKPKVRVIDTVVHSHYKAEGGEGGDMPCRDGFNLCSTYEGGDEGRDGRMGRWEEFSREYY